MQTNTKKTTSGAATPLYMIFAAMASTEELKLYMSQLSIPPLVNAERYKVPSDDTNKTISDTKLRSPWYLPIHIHLSVQTCMVTHECKPIQIRIRERGLKHLHKLARTMHGAEDTPSPLYWAYSKMVLQAQAFHVLTISPSDIDWNKLLRAIQNFDFAFIGRSSNS